MNILVYGTNSFEDYPTFMRGIAVAIQSNPDPEDKKINIFTAGPHKINNFTAEFVNRSEGLVKQKKVRMRFSRVSFKDVLNNFDQYAIDQVVSFNARSDRDKSYDPIIKKAEELGVDASFYRY